MEQALLCDADNRTQRKAETDAQEVLPECEQ